MNLQPTLTSLTAHGVAYAPAIATAAARHGLDPNLLAAVAAQETGGPGANAGRNVVGDGGHGHGLFQNDDRWHAFAATSAAMDPSKNADYAAGMLSDLLARYGGDVRKALSAYNAGSPDATGTKTTWADGQTLGYADSVLRHYGQLTGQPPDHEVRGLPPNDAGELLAALSSRAQSLPSSPPALPSPPHHAPYHRQETDYTQFPDDNDD